MRTNLKIKLGAIGLAFCLAGISIAYAAQMTLAGAPAAGTAPAKQAAVSGGPTEGYGNWKFECATPPGSQPICRVFQRLVQSDGAKRQFVMSASLLLVASGPEAGAAVTPHLRILTPEGVDLPTGIVANIDKSQPFKIPFQICAAGKCIADGAIADNLMAQLGSGKAMAVTYRIGMTKPVTVELSLAGFPTALQALRQQAGNQARKG